jgi:hypothetical protein
MQDLKEEIATKIKDNRPKLAPTSLKTFVSILSNIYKQTHGHDGTSWFSDYVKHIIQFIHTKNVQTKKTSLSALYVLTGEQEYKDIMTKVMAEVNAAYKLQKKTVKQEDNWMLQDEIKAVHNNLHENALKMLSKKTYIQR